MKEQLISLEEDLSQLTDMLQLEAQSIPNITHPDVPIGGEDSSAVRKTVCRFLEFFFVLFCFISSFDFLSPSSHKKGRSGAWFKAEKLCKRLD